MVGPCPGPHAPGAPPPRALASRPYGRAAGYQGQKQQGFPALVSTARPFRLKEAGTAAALDTEPRKLANRLSPRPTAVYTRIPGVMRASWTAGLERQPAMEKETFRALAASEDFPEGVEAFRDGRPNRFRGR